MRQSTPFSGSAGGRPQRLPLDPAVDSKARQLPPGRRIDDAEPSIFNEGEHVMSKSQDSKKNVKKAPAKSPKEKKEAKKLKKAERKH
jgi:hypothetical protein